MISKRIRSLIVWTAFTTLLLIGTIKSRRFNNFLYTTWFNSRLTNHLETCLAMLRKKIYLNITTKLYLAFQTGTNTTFQSKHFSFHSFIIIFQCALWLLQRSKTFHIMERSNQKRVDWEDLSNSNLICRSHSILKHGDSKTAFLSKEVVIFSFLWKKTVHLRN